MNTNDTQDKALDSTPDQSVSVEQPVAKPISDKPTKPQMGRFQRFGRSVLTWLVVIVIAFLAGVLTLFFTRYQLLNAALAQTQGELAQANQRVSQLKAEVTEVNNQMASLKTDNQAMQSELDANTVHLGLLQALTDVNSARLALVNDDISAAKAALKNSAAQLEILTPAIAKVDANLAESMPQRLTLILSGLDNDADTAKVDLELLAGNLSNLETLLFKKE